MIDDNRIDELADAFEAAWNSGKRIGADIFLADFVGDDESVSDYQDLLQELHVIEKELHRKYPLTSLHIQATPSQFLGNYEVFEQIGHGGMGELYRARHVLLDKIVAIKILPEKISGNLEIIKRFERELKLIGSLTHPNIVQAHGAERIDGKLLLVMEYIAGQNLRQMTASGKRLSLREALSIVRQVAAGLQYAYEHKIVHRDIKPANIMVAENGIAKILDFGLGKFHDELLLAEHEDESGPLTQLGSPIGTVDYLAPEQWSDPASVDIRADIYGLGCTFYTILAGDVPYPSDKFRSISEKMVAHMNRPLPSFMESGIVEDAGIEAILRKMCAKDRTQRFATPQELLDALDEYQRADVVVVLPPRRRWGRMVAGTVIVCLLGVASLVVPHLIKPRVSQRAEQQEEQTESESNAIVSEVLANRHRGDIRTARRLCREWLDDLKNATEPPSQSELALVQELFADCTLYDSDPQARGYEHLVEEAEELYLQAMALTESTEKKSILNSKRAILQMITGNPLQGLRTLEADASASRERSETERSDVNQSFLFFETAKGIGGFYCAETHQERQESLRRVLDTFRLNIRPLVFPLKDSWELERVDLQLLCIRQLLEDGLLSDDPTSTRRDAAVYLDRILFGAMAAQRELRPHLRKDFELAIRCFKENLLKQAEYIYCQRMDNTPREGTAQLLFYFTQQGGFAIFLPGNLSGGEKFELPWTREELRVHRANRSLDSSNFLLDERLVALVQAEWDAGRKVALSWNDEVCFPPNEGFSYADWLFDSQLKLQSFIGIEK